MYEKVSKYSQLGKFTWNKAKFIDLQIDDKNGEFYEHSTTGEKYFKLVFYFADEKDFWICRDMPYSKTIIWKELTGEEHCIKTLKTCGVYAGDLSRVNEALQQDNFVSLKGDVEQDGDYVNYNFWINPVRTQKSINEVDTKSLLAKFSKMNQPNNPVPTPADAISTQQVQAPTQQAYNAPPVVNATADVIHNQQPQNENLLDDGQEIPF